MERRFGIEVGNGGLEWRFGMEATYSCRSVDLCLALKKQCNHVGFTPLGCHMKWCDVVLIIQRKRIRIRRKRKESEIQIRRKRKESKSEENEKNPNQKKKNPNQKKKNPNQKKKKQTLAGKLTSAPRSRSKTAMFSFP